MRRQITLLLLTLPFCLIPLHSQAQSEYYWCKGEKIYLTPDKSTMSVFFEVPQVLEGMNSRNVSTIIADRASDRSPARWAVLNTSTFETEGMASSPAAVVRALGMEPSVIQSAEFGRITHKQDLVWLTHNIAYRVNSNFDQQLFSEILSDYPTARLETTGGGLPYVAVQNIDNVLSVANAMYESGMFHYAEPSFRQKGNSNSQHGEADLAGCNPGDPIFSEQMVLDNDGPTSAISSWTYPFWAPNVNGMDVNATDAWCVTTGNSSTVVAIFDEGLEAHKDLEDGSGSSRVLPGYNTDPAYATSGAPVGFDHNHGMGVAGIVGASHDGVGVVGLAPEVQMLPVHAMQKIFDDLQRADGIMWAYKNGADILINAWTYNSCTHYSSAIEDAVDSALTYGRGGLGTFVIFSSGHVETGNTNCMQFPANLTQAFTAGAVGTDQGIPDYAPVGVELDVVGVSSTDSSYAFVATLDRMVGGYNHTGTPPAYLEYADTAYTRYYGGTSTTAAEAGGIAALVLAMDNTLTASEIANIITSTASDFGGVFTTPSLHGAGVMDAHAAVLAAQNPVFPVTWNYVEGKVVGENIQLNWGTLSESNADRFEVEKLFGSEYATIGQVKAVGNTSSPSDYQFLDTDALIGDNIYRLKQVDQDGNSTYSSNVEVEMGESIWISEPYPNPATGSEISIDVFSPEVEQLSYKLIDLTGRVLVINSAELSAGNVMKLTLAVENLPAGMYVVEVSDQSGTKLSVNSVVLR